MTYEIPTELQYQEKIVFGLTTPQLARALLFSFLCQPIIERGCEQEEWPEAVDGGQEGA